MTKTSKINLNPRDGFRVVSFNVEEHGGFINARATIETSSATLHAGGCARDFETAIANLKDAISRISQ